MEEHEDILPSPFTEEIAFGVEAVCDFKESSFAEEISIANSFASKKRRAEFFAGRRAAHRALLSSGAKDLPLLKADSGRVIWPTGIIGSISHSKDYAVAAISSSKKYHGIGLDLEYKGKKRNPKIFSKILFDEELEWTSEDDFINKLKIFSAKEACYKAFVEKYSIKLSWKDIVFSPADYGLMGRVTVEWENETEVKVSIVETEDYILSGVLL